MVVVGGATVTSFVTETATMLIIGLIFSIFGIGLLLVAAIGTTAGVLRFVWIGRALGSAR